MATKAECDAAIDAAIAFAKTGRQCIATHRMYDNASPFTPLETVESVRAVQAARLANEFPAE